MDSNPVSVSLLGYSAFPAFPTYLLFFSIIEPQYSAGNAGVAFTRGLGGWVLL